MKIIQFFAFLSILVIFSHFWPFLLSIRIPRYSWGHPGTHLWCPGASPDYTTTTKFRPADLETINVIWNTPDLIGAKGDRKWNLLNFRRSQTHHFLTNLTEIHELLKAFFMLFQMRLAKNIFSQPCKRYKLSKLNGYNPKITNNHHNCNLAFFHQNSNSLLVFWLLSLSCNIIWSKNLIFRFLSPFPWKK